MRWMVLVLSVAACGDDANSRHILDSPNSAVDPPDYVWYVLDETSGTTAHDSSTNHYDITNLTGVTWGSGATFDGTGGGGSVDVDANFREAPITITAWASANTRADQTIDSHGLLPFPSSIIGDDIQAEFGYGLGLDIWTDGTPGNAMIVEGIGMCSVLSVSCAVPETQVMFTAGTEYFLAMTVASDGTANVYIDGANVETTTSTPLIAGTTTLWLGLHNNDTVYATKRFFAGKIRDARVYKRALSADDITALHTAGPTLHAP